MGKASHMSAQGMALTVLCTQLVDAVVKDELPEAGGCDISAGMFGPNLSQWLRDLAKELTANSDANVVNEYAKAYAEAQFEAALQIWASIRRHGGDPRWQYCTQGHCV